MSVLRLYWETPSIKKAIAFFDEMRSPSKIFCQENDLGQAVTLQPQHFQ
jgi:hypothetical protein